LSFLDPKRKIYCDPGAHPGMVLRCPGVNARRWVIADWIPCVPTIAHGDKGGRMFKSILIPTDGSKLSDQAVRQGLQLAKSLGAKVVALHVTAPFHVLAASAAALTETREQSEKRAAEFSKQIFDVIAGMAREAGVACTCHSHSGEHVWQEIIMAAEKFGCDAICMASHGRRGIGAVLIGSETVKVLTHSNIPVLVVR